MEHGCDGHLYNFVNTKQELSEEATSIIIKQLLEATSYMHSFNTLHRDIKPENIVMIHVAFNLI